jgi:hypothetical protein
MMSEVQQKNFRENDVWSSASFDYVILYKNIWRQFYSINDNWFKLTISVNYYFVFRNPPDRFKKVANCVNYKIKLEQGDFERILGFEHFLRDIENIAS